MARDIQTAIAGKAGQRYACEIKRIGIATRTDIICAVIGHIALAGSGAGAILQDYCKSARTKLAHLSPIIILGALVLPDIKRGMMLASAM